MSSSQAKKMRKAPSHDSLKEYTHDDGGATIERRSTVVESAVNKRKGRAHEFLTHIPTDGSDTSDLFAVDQYMPPTLQNAIFCGHLVADLDSIAGALGAAELYGGVAARASDINSETQFAIDLWGASIPQPIEDALNKYPDSGVCLVDHQQTSQLNKAIPVERIVGVIDHHALQNSTIVTDMPIYIDIRPWGSMSTIITHTFLMMRRRPTKKTAGMLLCAILSDTLNLQGPTTTEWDRLMVAALVEIAGVEDVQFLASQQFKAKSSELAGLSAEVLVNGDQKEFNFKTAVFEGAVGFAVVETTDDEVIMARKDELLVALDSDKESKGLSLLYLAVVNIVSLKSTLLCVSQDEASLAQAAFANGVMLSDNIMDLGGLVSRKKDFIPAVTKAIKNGWAKSSASASATKMSVSASSGSLASEETKSLAAQ